jgi:hypothetical protein
MIKPLPALGNQFERTIKLDMRTREAENPQKSLKTTKISKIHPPYVTMPVKTTERPSARKEFLITVWTSYLSQRTPRVKRPIAKENL